MSFSLILLLILVIAIGVYSFVVVSLNNSLVQLDLLFLEFDISLGSLILISFLLGISRREEKVNEAYVFLLLLLLKILYNNGFDDVLLEPLRIRFLEPRNIEEFSKFSLQVCEPSNSRPSKLFLGEFADEQIDDLNLICYKL